MFGFSFDRPNHGESESEREGSGGTVGIGVGVKRRSRVKELERKIQEGVVARGSLDFTLIASLQREAARHIQWAYREYRARRGKRGNGISRDSRAFPGIGATPISVEHMPQLVSRKRFITNSVSRTPCSSGAGRSTQRRLLT